MTDVQGGRRGGDVGNSKVGEKNLEGSDSDTENDLPEDDVKKVDVDDGEQGTQDAAVVVGGEAIVPENELTDKEKKKLQQREAKRRRDEKVSKLTKTVQDVLGDSADLGERMTK